MYFEGVSVEKIKLHAFSGVNILLSEVISDLSTA